MSIPKTYSRSRPRQSKKFNYKNFKQKSSKTSHEHEGTYTNSIEIAQIQEELTFIEERLRIEAQPIEQDQTEDDAYDRLQIMWVDPNGNSMLIHAIE